MSGLLPARWLAWFIILTNFNPLFASVDNFVIRTFTTEDGLPENSATSMAQDHDGYLWFGTFNGLVRYDGVRFTVFGPGNSKLPHVGIVKLRVDRAGALWVATLGGIARLFQGKWISFPDLVHPPDYPLDLVESPHGGMYAGTDGGKVFHFQNDAFVQIGDFGERHQIAFDGDQLFVNTSNSMKVRVSGNWSQAGIPSPATSGAKEAAWATSPSSGLLYVLRNRLFRITQGEVFREYALPARFGRVVEAREDKDGSFWLSSYADGLAVVSNTGNVSLMDRASGFPSSSIRFSFRDREGVVWAGTNGDGLFRLRERRFRNLGTASGLPLFPFKSVAFDGPEKQYIATYGAGVWLIERGKARRAFPTMRPVFTQTVLVDRRKRIWMGTYRGGLWLHDKGLLAELESGKTVEALFEDSKGRIWIGLEDGVGVYVDGALRKYPLAPMTGLVPIACFAESPKGDIWAGGDGGVYRLEGDSFRAVDFQGARIPAARSLHLMAEGNGWVGTSLEGLLFLRDGKVHKVAGPTSSLSIGAIIPEGPYLWLATSNGVWRVNRELWLKNMAEDPESLALGTEDGIASRECAVGHQPMALRDETGKIWIATLKGVSVLDPNSIRDQAPDDPHVVFEQVWYRDRTGVEHQALLRQGAEVILPSGAMDVRVEYTTTQTTAAHDVQFAYDFQSGGNVLTSGRMKDRNIRLFRLPAGASELRLKVQDTIGRWSRHEAVLALYRQPFYWETDLFRIASGAASLLLVLSAAWMIGNARVRKREREMRTAQEIADIRARLAAVLENTSDVVGFATPNFDTLYLNRAGRDLLGIDSRADLRNLNLESFLCTTTQQMMRADALPYSIQHGAWQGYITVIGAGSRMIPMWQKIVVHYSDSGAPEFFSTIARDMTEIRATEFELREAKQKAEETSRLKSEFLANMSHEIRTPMNGILGMAQVLSLTNLDKEQSEFLGIVRTSAEALHRLLNDILDFSKIEADRLELMSAPFDPRATVQDVVSLLATAASSKHIELRWHVAGDVPSMVSGDAHRWRQILLNYLDNAVKFTKSGSVDLSVEVAGRRDGRIGLRASVRDTGCGIDPDKLQFIFEKFTQADSSMTRGHGGTGLGLAIVRQLAALMGGSAGVESEAGHGSHFWATAWFEAIQPTAVWPAEKFSAPAIETRMDGRHVLLVEDNSINQKVVERMLERLGCMVIIAANGEEALRRMESHRVDLVLMDVMMPVMDGLEATRRIRQMPSPAGRVPVIILSASAMTEDRERAIAAGADRFIAKPVSIESLEEALSVRLS